MIIEPSILQGTSNLAIDAKNCLPRDEDKNKKTNSREGMLFQENEEYLSAESDVEGIY